MGWLENKCLVVIGGTSGIGLSAVTAFLQEGAKVVAIGLDADISALSEKYATKNVVFTTGNALQEGTAASAIELCVNNFSAFHGLYHVAGGSGRKYGDGPLHEISLEGWNKTLELNLTSLMLSNKAAVQFFTTNHSNGTILNMASVLGYSPSPGHFVTHAYATAKAAVIGFTQSTAAYYAAQNIRINAIAPSLIETPMSQRAMNDLAIQSFIHTKQPLDGGRMGRPADLDGAAIYFMSDYSRFTTGQTLAVDGGWSISEGQYA